MWKHENLIFNRLNMSLWCFYLQQDKLGLKLAASAMAVSFLLTTPVFSILVTAFKRQI